MRAKAVALILASFAMAPAHAQAPSFADVNRVLRSNCAMACHNQADPQGGLDLTPKSAWANLVNRKASGSAAKLVVPGKSEKSYLLAKLLGTQAKLGGGGLQMPVGGRLSAEDIDLIRTWIAAGASN